MHAVDRVDHPDPIERPGHARGALLAVERIGRKRRGKLGRDQPFDRAVGMADEVLRALVLDVERVALRKKTACTLAGQTSEFLGS